jgi:hypothetical protein
MQHTLTPSTFRPKLWNKERKTFPQASVHSESLQSETNYDKSLILIWIGATEGPTIAMVFTCSTSSRQATRPVATCKWSADSLNEIRMWISPFCLRTQRTKCYNMALMHKKVNETEKNHPPQVFTTYISFTFSISWPLLCSMATL